MRSNRIIASTALVVLASLIAAAVTIQVAASGGTDVGGGDLVVAAGPLRTATGVLTLTDSTGVTATADCTIDFADGTADVDATVSLSIASVNLEARLVDHRVDLNVAQFESLVGAPWVWLAAPKESAGLDAIATLLRRPDLRHGVTSVVHLADGETQTTLRGHPVRLPSTSGLPITLPRRGTEALTVTTGLQGQLVAIADHLVGSQDHVVVTLRMTSYDQAVSVEVPSAAVPLTPRIAQDVFGTNARRLTELLGRLGELRP